jgi:CHAD domain-containing protein
MGHTAPVAENRSPLLETLKAAAQPVSADDGMGTAGKKAMLAELRDVLAHEAGTLTGDDIEDVHDMRVATRRLRSTLRLLKDYYKPKTVRAYNRMLRKIARALGSVRDLDVLIADMHAHARRLESADSAVAAENLRAAAAWVYEQREAARHDLTLLYQKGEYRRFVEDFAAFLMQDEVGMRTSDNGEIQPTHVRHVLPALVYSHLGAVRAYDGALAEADDTLLHALRIEFKRLRYAVSLFDNVLGTGVKDFLNELKAIQDHLGRIQDIATAHAVLDDADAELLPEHAEAVAAYLAALDEEAAALRRTFPEVWKRFNGKAVQKQLATAISAL